MSSIPPAPSEARAAQPAEARSAGAAAAPVASVPARVVAGVTGLLALALVSVLTVGVAFAATLGVAVAGALARRRGKPLTRTTSWIGAVAGAGLALVALAGFGASALPEGTLDEIRHASDSVAANSKPPAWLERVAPGTAARMQKQARQEPSAVSGAVNIWAGVTGVVIGLGFIATFVGTLGWAAALPLAFAFTGRWMASSGT